MNETKVLGLATEAFKLVGSLGGILYLVTLFNLYRNRVRVKIRILSEDRTDDNIAVLWLEAQNIGSTPTSIEPRVSFSGFLPPRKGKSSWRVRMPRYAFDFVIEGSGRTLQPYVPVRLEAQSSATSDLVENLNFMFFKTYTFSFTRGRKKKVRLYSIDGARLNFFQYWTRRLLVMVFGIRGFRKPDDRSEEVSAALSR